MNILISLIIGYVIHDAVQPTAVGKVLDKFALPADTFTSVSEGVSDEPTV